MILREQLHHPGKPNCGFSSQPRPEVQADITNLIPSHLPRHSQASEQLRARLFVSPRCVGPVGISVNSA